MVARTLVDLGQERKTHTEQGLRSKKPAFNTLHFQRLLVLKHVKKPLKIAESVNCIKTVNIWGSANHEFET